jgi:hypothetical protein
VDQFVHYCPRGIHFFTRIVCDLHRAVLSDDVPEIIEAEIVAVDEKCCHNYWPD